MNEGHFRGIGFPKSKTCGSINGSCWTEASNRSVWSQDEQECILHASANLQLSTNARSAIQQGPTYSLVFTNCFPIMQYQKSVDRVSFFADKVQFMLGNSVFVTWEERRSGRE